MDELIEILEDIQPDADYETCTTLIDRITPAEIIPENFNSAQALYAMVQRLQG